MERSIALRGARVPANHIIVQELETFLRESRVRHVHFSDGTTVPPPLAYVTNFPRLSVPLSGCHTMEISRNGSTKTIRPLRGHAVFVPSHAWNKPDWEARIDVLTILFGVKQIGVSLVRQKGGMQMPSAVLKASVHGGYDVPTHSILAALMALAADHSEGTLARLLTESLLHACLRLLNAPQHRKPRKAIRTYESICLYLQENFQNPLTRESVAEHFGLAPNHVSRLFRKEGLMRFNDYLNLVRVNRAKFMLQNYSMTLKEIAANCCYTDTAYFCRVFKKICKVTPTEYRAYTLANKAKAKIAAVRLATGAEDSEKMARARSREKVT